MLHTTFSASAPERQLSVCLTCGNPITRPHLVARHIATTNLPVLVKPSIKSIARDVARRRGDVTVEEIFSTARTHRIAHARQEVMWEGRKVGLSFPMIGRRFPGVGKSGHMDHSTAIWGVERHEERRRAALIAEVQADNLAAAARNAL